MTTTPIRCVDRQCDDGPPLDDQPGPRLARTGLLCQKHADRLERHLAELPSQHDALRAILGGLTSGSRGENKKTKGQPPIPLNLAAHDHLQQMLGVLTSWVLLVTEERDLHGPDRQTVPSLSGWLLGQVDWLAAQPWVDDLAAELDDLARTANGLAQTRPGWNLLPVPCPGCEAHTIGRWDGDDHIGCSTCGERWPESEYPWFVRVVADRESLTAAQAVERADVDAQVFRQWVSRGHVSRVGTVDGEARYDRQQLDDYLAKQERTA